MIQSRAGFKLAGLAFLYGLVAWFGLCSRGVGAQAPQSVAPSGMHFYRAPSAVGDYLAGKPIRSSEGFSYFPMSFIAQGEEGLGPNYDGEDWNCPSPTWNARTNGAEGWNGFGNFNGPTVNTANACVSPETGLTTGSRLSIPLSTNDNGYSDAYFRSPSSNPLTENTHWSAWFSGGTTADGGTTTIYILGKTGRGDLTPSPCVLTTTPTLCGLSSLGGKFTQIAVGCVGAASGSFSGFSVPCAGATFCMSDVQVHQGTERRTFIQNAGASPSYYLPPPRVRWGSTTGPALTTSNNGQATCRRGDPYDFANIQPGDYVWYTLNWPRVTGSSTGTPTLHGEASVSDGIQCSEDLMNATHWGNFSDGGAANPEWVDGGNPLIAGAFAPDPFGGAQGTHFRFPATSGIQSSMRRNLTGSCSSATNCTASIHLWVTDGGSGTLDLCAVNNTTVFGCKACPYNSTAINRCYLNTTGSSQWFAFGNASRFMDGGARPEQTVIVSHPQFETATWFGAYPTSYIPRTGCGGASRAADEFTLIFDAGIAGQLQDAGCVALTIAHGSTGADTATWGGATLSPYGVNRTPINRAAGGQLNMGGLTTTISTCNSTACWQQGTPARFLARWQPGVQSIRTAQGQVDGGSTGLNPTIAQPMKVASPVWPQGLVSDIQLSTDPTACEW